MTERITEADFQRTVTDLADLYGWKWVHYRQARTAKGWATPLSGSQGAPDLLLVRDRVIFAELKSKSGKLTDAQRDWGVALLAANAEYYTWRPSDWSAIAEVLK